eukprot:c18668_g1_i1.p1 GENE.c18668_g1_i1~~c18668_g1_i1.p1  ORF type:complete len:133 (+),score=22.26 c18668_g1_i1:52-450(+)
MPYKRFVEVGRVVLVNYGPDSGKLAVIIDVLDQNRALVECPNTGIIRQQLPFRRMALTDIKIEIPRSPRTQTIQKAFTEAKVSEQWEKTSWAKKRSSAVRRAALTDFERFKVTIGRKQRSNAIHKEFTKLKK